MESMKSRLEISIHDITLCLLQESLPDSNGFKDCFSFLAFRTQFYRLHRQLKEVRLDDEK